ncbi:hypothetical protein [Sporosarcina obsidiansis]|nr:hypothetical protein [Sporosarcina obsidiansis]
MNRRQTILLTIIIVAILLYCWILFFELPDKMSIGMTQENIEMVSSQLL